MMMQITFRAMTIFFAAVMMFVFAVPASSATIFRKPIARSTPNHTAAYDLSAPLTLAENGTVQVSIMVLPDAPPATRFAASEMKRCLERCIGASVPLSDSIGDGVTILYLHRDSAKASSYGIAIAGLPRDAFIIRRVKENGRDIIVLAGRDDPAADPEQALKKGHWAQLYERATLFATYEFLERFIGVRYFFPAPEGIVVPRASTVIVPSMSIYEAPDFTVRRVSHFAGSLPGGIPETDSAKVFPWVNAEWMANRMETFYIPNCHGMSRMGLTTRFAKSRPDYFSLLPNGQRETEHGHLCLKNKDLENEIAADFLAYLRGESAASRGVKTKYGEVWEATAFQPGYVNAMPQDGFSERNFCRCALCMPLYNPDGRYSEYVFDFVARIAERIKASGTGGKVTTMAYATYVDVPTVTLPDNVIIQVATIGPWREKDPSQAADDALIRSWNKKLGGQKQVYLWNYMNNYNEQVPSGIPAVNPRAVASYYKRLAPEITGAFIQIELSQRIFQYLNTYMFGKVAWDNDIDPEALLLDHHASMFCPAAGTMKKFFDALERTWMTKGFLGFADHAFGPQLIARSETSLWNDVYDGAFIAQLADIIAAAKKEAAADADALTRIAYIERAMLGEMEQARNASIGKNRELDDLVIAAPAGTVTVDGSLSDPAWGSENDAYLVPYRKDDTVKALTGIRLRRSDTHIYIAFECFEPNPERMQTADRSPDDNEIWRDNSIEVFLNPSRDRKRYFHLMINSRGAVADESCSPEKKNDMSWQSGAKVACTVGTDRWTAEIAVPFESLGMSAFDAEGIVANFCRSRVLSDGKGNQLQTWSPFLNKGFHDIDRFGTAVPSVKANAENIIKNGSFEAVSAGVPTWWIFPKDGGASVEGSLFRHGRQCVRITGDATQGRIFIAQGIDAKVLKSNTEYTISYYVRTENLAAGAKDPNGGGYVNIAGVPGNVFLPKRWYTGTLGWTKESFTFKTGDLGQWPTLRIGFAGVQGTMWIDDVRLQEK